VGTDNDGNPLYARDGTSIQWSVEGPGGSFAQAVTTTQGGYAFNTLNTSTHAGDTYLVFARILNWVNDGDGTVVPGPEATVVPCIAATIDFAPDRTELPADGTSTTTVTLTTYNSLNGYCRGSRPVSDDGRPHRGAAMAWRPRSRRGRRAGHEHAGSPGTWEAPSPPRQIPAGDTG
jgi:hypothetical protein